MGKDYNRKKEHKITCYQCYDYHDCKIVMGKAGVEAAWYCKFFKPNYHCRIMSGIEEIENDRTIQNNGLIASMMMLIYTEMSEKILDLESELEEHIKKDKP